LYERGADIFISTLSDLLIELSAAKFKSGLTAIGTSKVIVGAIFANTELTGFSVNGRSQ
jgi:hypothetical protein